MTKQTTTKQTTRINKRRAHAASNNYAPAWPVYLNLAEYEFLIALVEKFPGKISNRILDKLEGHDYTEYYDYPA